METISIAKSSSSSTYAVSNINILSTTVLYQVIDEFPINVELITAAATILNWGCEYTVITKGNKGSSVYFLTQYNSSDLWLNNYNSENYNKINIQKYQYNVSIHNCDVTIGESSINMFITEVYIEAYKLSNIVDTTGAGDAFAAGFLVQLLTHYSLFISVTDELLLFKLKIELLVKCLVSGRKTSSAAIGNIGGSNINVKDLDHFD